MSLLSGNVGRQEAGVDRHEGTGRPGGRGGGKIGTFMTKKPKSTLLSENGKIGTFMKPCPPPLNYDKH